jgi:hypothetical protein
MRRYIVSYQLLIENKQGHFILKKKKWVIELVTWQFARYSNFHIWLDLRFFK